MIFIISECQSRIWESGNAAKLLRIEVKPLFSHRSRWTKWNSMPDSGPPGQSR